MVISSSNLICPSSVRAADRPPPGPGGDDDRAKVGSIRLMRKVMMFWKSRPDGPPRS